MDKILIILNYLKDGFIKFLKIVFKDIKVSIIILLLLVISILFMQKCTAEKKISKLQAELIEQTDTITTYKNKNGELYSQVQTYVTDNKTLKKINEDLYKEYKSLKENPTVIVKTEVVTKIDSIFIDGKIETIDSLRLYSSDFKYNDKYCNIDGNTVFDIANSVSKTNISNIIIPTTITTDLVEKNNSLYFLSKSDNPYVQINNIEGTVISPEQSKLLNKKNKRNFGVVLGIGPSVTVIDNTVKLYPSVNLTIGWKIIDF